MTDPMPTGTLFRVQVNSNVSWSEYKLVGCDCDGNLDLGCGCGLSGPLGCNFSCDDDPLDFDECGVCDGDGTSCLGDINGDGNINVVDIVALVNIILHDLDPEGADYNGDGTVNVIDVVELVQFVLNN